MAITSVAGASLTKNHSSGAGSPVQVSFTSQSYCGWVKIPSIGTERILFDHDGRLKIGIDTVGKIFLLLDGVNRFTGTTIIPTNKWVFWGFRRQSTTQHTITLTWLECVSNNPVVQPILTEINVTQSIAAGNPASFTVNIPAGCSICGFRYGVNGFNISTSAFAWATTSSSSYVWRPILRFPNDLYDHREISASSGDVTFNGMHNWDNQTGTIILDSNGDPEHLLDKICSAVLGVVTGLTLDTTHAPIPPSTQVTNNTVPLPITINTDVLPATARIDRVTIGAYAQLIDPDPSYPVFVLPDTWGFYRKTPDPTVYGPYEFAGDQYDYYDWSHFGAPSFGFAPGGINPSTGLPWTLADYYASIFYAGCKWGPWSGGGGFATAKCYTHRTIDAGIGVLYYGQSTPGTCGGGPPASVGTIIVDKIVTPNNGETFQFNAVNLTPNAFTLDDATLQQYDNVPAGNGYGITEIVPSGWTVSYNVSNGSPHDNIAVVAGDTVVVTVTNTKLPNLTSGIYKVVPGKRNDTLWNEDFEGETDVKIPNPFIKGPFIGE